MHRNSWLLFCLSLLLILPQTGLAASFTETVRGRILLDVENHGEAWYVYPPTMLRSYLGRPADAFTIMRSFGLGITDADLADIPTSEENQTGDYALRQRLSGRILLQVEEHGEAWYVYPGDLRRYYLGRPDDAFSVMRSLGLGITSADLARVAIDPSSIVPVTTETHTFHAFTLTNAQGSFPVSVLTMKKETFAMATDTAEPADCDRDCAALSLKTYVERNDGLAGIHGTYFCPPDYADCAQKINSFLSPVFNSQSGEMINEDQLRFFNRPLVAYTTNGQYHYFHRASEFGKSVAAFEASTGKTLAAAIGNWPALVEHGASVTQSEPSEPGFTLKGTRGGIGFNDDTIFLVIAQGATVENFASIFVSLGATEALNLDGGGSASLFVDGAYKVGPGRLLPNAVVFKER
jgi:hypothetical protein